MSRHGPRFAVITSAAHLVERTPAAQPVMAHAGRVLKAGRIYALIAPPALARISRVANVKEGVVVIHTEHGAAASKLKQLTGHLVGAFLKRGFECTGIEIRVQPDTLPPPPPPPTAKPLGVRALASLEELAARLHDGSPLQERIRHLMERAARR